MSITILLIITTALLSYFSWQNPDRQRKWLFNPYSIKKYKEYQRFITSGFIHANSAHLIFNMIALYFFGRNVEYKFSNLFGGEGTILFIVFYILGIIISDIPSYIKYKDLPAYNSLGASGGVSAIVFSSIMFFPLDPIYIMFIPIGIPGFILGTLYIIYSYYQGKRMGDNINHDAHLWGALFGVVFTIILVPGVVPSFFEQVFSFSIF